MAVILVVEEDGVLAWQMVRTLRQAGHQPILASYTQAALREAEEQPDVIVLDLDFLDGRGGELLARLRSQPGTGRIPVLAVMWQREAGLHFREEGFVAEVLRKPLSGVHFRDAVERILARQGPLHGVPTLSQQERQLELILRLIIEGSDLLVMHISRRLSADRTSLSSSQKAHTLTWDEIAEWGRREGLLDVEQANLLRCVSLVDASKNADVRAARF